MRGWLGEDAAYRTLARTCIAVLGDRQLARPLHLDTVNGKYREQFPAERRDALSADDFTDQSKLRSAMRVHWNEQQGYPRVKTFEEMLK